MSVDPSFKWQVLAAVGVQLLTFYLIREVRSPIALLVIAYAWIRGMNHNQRLTERQRFL